MAGTSGLGRFACGQLAGRDGWREAETHEVVRARPRCGLLQAMLTSCTLHCLLHTAPRIQLSPHIGTGRRMRAHCPLAVQQRQVTSSPRLGRRPLRAKWWPTCGPQRVLDWPAFIRVDFSATRLRSGWLVGWCKLPFLAVTATACHAPVTGKVIGDTLCPTPIAESTTPRVKAGQRLPHLVTM